MLFNKVKLSFFPTTLYTADELVDKLLEAAVLASKREEIPTASIVCEKVQIKESSRDAKPKEKGKEKEGRSLYKIIGKSVNCIFKYKDPTAHSEILAIKKASHYKRNERLNECTLFTTLEPCLMCSGAIILARFLDVYYLSPSHKGPALSWILELSRNQKSKLNKNPSLNHYPKLFHLKDREAEYKLLLSSFFKDKRN